MCFCSLADRRSGQVHEMTAQPSPPNRPTGSPGGPLRPANMPGHFRVSQAEREAVAEQLRQHTTEGRLSLDEFGDRLDACLNAKTYDQLGEVLRDLPALQAPPVVQEAPPPPPRVQVRVPPHLPFLTVALLASMVAAFVTHHVFPFVFLAVWCAFMVRRAWRRDGLGALPPSHCSNRSAPKNDWSRHYPPTDNYRRGPYHGGYDQQV